VICNFVMFICLCSCFFESKSRKTSSNKGFDTNFCSLYSTFTISIPVCQRANNCFLFMKMLSEVSESSADSSAKRSETSESISDPSELHSESSESADEVSLAISESPESAVDRSSAISEGSDGIYFFCFECFPFNS